LRVVAMGGGAGETLTQEDLVVMVSYADGSLATITYAENGHPSTPKERLEILGRGHSALIDDFKRLTIDGKDVKMTSSADKGHVRNLEFFRKVVGGLADGSADLKASLETTATMLAAAESLSSGSVEKVRA